MPEDIQLKQYDDSRDNKRMSIMAMTDVVSKVGAYIFNMGAVNFFEYLVINLFLVIHVDRR